MLWEPAPGPVPQVALSCTLCTHITLCNGQFMHVELPISTLSCVQEVQDEAPKPYSASEGMQGIVALLERSVKTKETRLLMGRLMRQTAQLRSHMTAADLDTFITTYLPADSKSGAYLAGYIKQVTATQISSCICVDLRPHHLAVRAHVYRYM